MTTRVFVLGTRGSRLALAQSTTVARAIEEAGARLGEDVRVDLEVVRTHGDVSTAPLAALGGVGVFAAQLRLALLGGECDLAVHSFKDLPTAPTPGLRIAAVPQREDPRDALCAADDDALSEWTHGLLAVSCEASPAAGEGSLALVVSEVSGAPRAVRARALREVASRAGIRLLSGVHVDALDDLIVAWRGQGPIPLPGGRATRVGRGTQARILFEARSPEPTRDGG